MQLLRTPLSFRNFALLLALMLVLMLGKRPSISGDFEEYALMTIAVANHASPDIRNGDIEVALRLLPKVFAPRLVTLAEGIETGAEVPLTGFYRGSDGAAYAIHFFAFSALAAAPYKLLEAVGANPLKCYQVLNLTCIFVLGLAMFRFLGNASRAFGGLVLFLLCGGALYWNWTSPEIMSATALLGGFLYFASGAPLAGGLLVGLASMQNPSIVLALAFAPLAPAWQQRSLAPLFKPGMLAGLALGFLLFACSPAFNFMMFGTPSIIAKVSTSREFISVSRLVSLFFDLNQGMIVAIPGVAAMLAVWGWKRTAWRGQLALALTCAACTIILCLPALSVGNWNSGAAGVMRYAFWAAMPLLFVLLYRLRQLPQWPSRIMIVLLAVQLGATMLAKSYSHTQFSPQARWVVTHLPAIYNPEPEIFIERLSNAEIPMDPARTYQWLDKQGRAVKMLYFAGAETTASANAPCGRGQMLAPQFKPVPAGGHWAYLNGPFECQPHIHLRSPSQP